MLCCVTLGASTQLSEFTNFTLKTLKTTNHPLLELSIPRDIASSHRHPRPNKTA